MDNQEEFLKMIQETFRIEAKENIELITSNLLELEKGIPADKKAELLELTFRSSHSLKGASRAVSNPQIEVICQAMENVFSDLKRNIIELHSAMFDVFHEAVNVITFVLELADDKIDAKVKNKVEGIVHKLDDLTGKADKSDTQQSKDPEIIDPSDTVPLQEDETVLENPHIIKEEFIAEDAPSESKTAEKKALSNKELNVSKGTQSNTIRVATERLDSILFQVEEMLTVKLNSQQRIENIRKLLNEVENKENNFIHNLVSYYDIKYILQDKEKKGTLDKMGVSFLKLIRDFEDYNRFLSIIRTQTSDLYKDSKLDNYHVSSKIEDLLYSIKKLISVPISSITKIYPKVVRDIAHDQAKKINISIHGDDLEIDRRILEEIRDPLMHILRNCIDHGIETPAVRKQKGKSETGSIKLKIARLEDNKVEIAFSDDGAGLDFDKLRSKYQREVQIDKKAITESMLIRYVFSSGISTAPMITDMSGRGLGMAIVKEKVEKLGGSISLDSQKDKGINCKIVIPLSLVNFTGVLVKVAEDKFVIPTTKIDKILRVAKENVKSIKNRASLIYRDKVYVLNRVADTLQLESFNEESDHLIVIIFSMNDQNIGFVVDEVIGEDIFQTKKFNKHLAHIKNITGATILGTGEIVPILSVYDLLNSVPQEQFAPIRKKDKQKKDSKKKILIVEDSITSRMLLKNILEAAGYEVQTAIDGIEGYTKVKEFDFDLVCSDVDMPRLTGLDMTAKIRSEKKFENLPIILVTSLSKKEDKERGMEVGANAYIVKSDFNQSNLLETIERLV